MWTVVYIAKNRELAQKVRELLVNAGLPVTVRPLGEADGEASCFEVLVPETEVSEAHTVMIAAGI